MRAALLALLIAFALLADELGVELPEPVLPPNTQHAVANIWVQIGIMLVSALISYALAPKPPKPKPAALADFDVPTAEEGRSIPVIFGTVWLKGPNVLWYGDLSSKPIKSKGKK